MSKPYPYQLFLFKVIFSILIFAGNQLSAQLVKQAIVNPETFSGWIHGGRSDDWVINARSDVYGHSCRESSKDAAEFICRLMDYTGRDMVYSEGEFTGWGDIGRDYCLVPKGFQKRAIPAAWSQQEPIKERLPGGSGWESLKISEHLPFTHKYVQTFLGKSKKRNS